MDDSRLARLHAAVDRAFYEDFAITTMAKPRDVNLRAGPDPDRVPVPRFRAKWIAQGKTKHAAHRTLSSSATRSTSGTIPMIEFPAGVLPYAVRVGDIITRLKTGARFEASTPLDGDFGLTQIPLADA